MKKLLAVLAVVVVLCAAAPAEAQSRTRSGDSFSSAFRRGLGFSLGASLGGGFSGVGAFRTSPLISPFRSSLYSPLRVSPFVDPLPFRVSPFVSRPVFAPLIRTAPLIRSSVVVEEPLVEFIETPPVRERIIIIR